MTAVSESTVKSGNKAPGVYSDYLIMTAAPFALAVCCYGVNALFVTAVSVLTAVLCDAAASTLLKKRIKLRDMSTVFTGAAIAMMMPSGIPLYIPAIASAFAVLAAKIPFGGGNKAPFVPAAAGFAFACVCFREEVFSFAGGDKFLGSSSLGSLLMQGSSVHLNSGNTFDLICGNVAGPMGTGCIILMLACCVFLFVRRRNALWATIGFVAVCAVFAFVFPRSASSRLTSVLLELSSGSLMFAAVFLITDPASMPGNDLSRFLFGAAGGLICMTMRKLGAYEEPVCFAVLLANGISPIIDSAAAKLSRRKIPSGGREEAAE